MTPTLKAWNGSSFIEKTMKVWDGSAHVQKPLKVWDGADWALVGGEEPAVVHSIGLDPSHVAAWNDGTPRIRLGTWFLSLGGHNTGWSCVGGRVYVPDVAYLVGTTLRISLIYQSAGPFNSSGIQADWISGQGDVVVNGPGWHQVMWTPVPFIDGGGLFIMYEFLDARPYTGYYLFDGSQGSQAQESDTLPGLYLPAYSDLGVNRSWFTMGTQESNTFGQAANESVWYGSEPLVTV